MVGPEGRVTGIDMTPEMLTKARGAAAELGLANVEFVESEAESLPFADRSFDVVISNGVVDLIPDKDAVFSAGCRVGLDPPAGEVRSSQISKSSGPLTLVGKQARIAGCVSIAKGAQVASAFCVRVCGLERAEAAPWGRCRRGIVESRDKKKMGDTGSGQQDPERDHVWPAGDARSIRPSDLRLLPKLCPAHRIQTDSFVSSC